MPLLSQHFKGEGLEEHAGRYSARGRSREQVESILRSKGTAARRKSSIVGFNKGS